MVCKAPYDLVHYVCLSLSPPPNPQLCLILLQNHGPSCFGPTLGCPSALRILCCSSSARNAFPQVTPYLFITFFKSLLNYHLLIHLLTHSKLLRLEIFLQVSSILQNTLRAAPCEILHLSLPIHVISKCRLITSCLHYVSLSIKLFFLAF